MGSPFRELTQSTACEGLETSDTWMREPLRQAGAAGVAMPLLGRLCEVLDVLERVH